MRRWLCSNIFQKLAGKYNSKRLIDKNLIHNRKFKFHFLFWSNLVNILRKTTSNRNNKIPSYVNLIIRSLSLLFFLQITSHSPTNCKIRKKRHRYKNSISAANGSTCSFICLKLMQTPTTVLLFYSLFKYFINVFFFSICCFFNYLKKLFGHMLHSRLHLIHNTCTCSINTCLWLTFWKIVLCLRKYLHWE